MQYDNRFKFGDYFVLKDSDRIVIYDTTKMNPLYKQVCEIMTEDKLPACYEEIWSYEFKSKK